MTESSSRATLAKLHEASTKACATWIGHESTRPLVEAERTDIHDRFWPTLLPLVSGNIHWPFAFAIATCGGIVRGDLVFAPPPVIYPDGRKDLVADRWLKALLADSEESAWLAFTLVDEMAKRAEDLALRLQRAGVPILANETADRVALVLLLLLNRNDLDWSRPRFVAEQVNFLPEFGYLGAGSAIVYSDRMILRQRRDAESLRYSYRQDQPGFRCIPRDRGGRPPGSTTTDSIAGKLATHLPLVLNRFPKTSAAGIRREWKRPGDSSGQMLRQLMGNPPGEPPSASTIQKALRKIRQ